MAIITHPLEINFDEHDLWINCKSKKYGKVTITADVELCIAGEVGLFPCNLKAAKVLAERAQEIVRHFERLEWD
jgi:hypothetical protein